MTPSPFDPEVERILATLPAEELLTAANLSQERLIYRRGVASIADDLKRYHVQHSQHSLPSPTGEITVSILRPSNLTRPAGGMVMLHGGGMVMGDRLTSYSAFGLVECVARLGLVLISPEYALAPERPFPAGVEDCVTAWQWGTTASQLGVDPGRWILAGISGGGGLAAAASLMIRDRRAVPPLAQLLICPMLDDRTTPGSKTQFSYDSGFGGVWPTESNSFCWDCVLGAGHEDRELSEYAAPSRSTNLSGLPPTYIEVGSADIFRDESVAFATQLWADGVAAELHVWQGGPHGFEASAPEAALSISARAARESWLERTLRGDH